MPKHTLLRASSRLAAGALVVGSFALLAPAANASTPPAGDTNVFGTVTDSNGVPQPDIYVDIYDVEADGTFDSLGYTQTDAAGQYWFDFTTLQTSDGNDNLSSSDRPQVKLAFGDGRDLTGDQLRLHREIFNDKFTLKQGDPVTLGAAGTTTTVPTVALTYQAGIKGTVSVPAPAGYYYEGGAAAYDVDDGYEDDASFDSDPLSTGRGNELTYLLDDLDPNQSYAVYFWARAYPISGVGEEINYVGHFYKNGTNTFSSATRVAVGAAGTITQGINDSLTNVMTAAESPSIIGQVAPGKTLKVDPGTWSYQADTTYTYQWLRNDVQISTAPTYKVAKGDLGKKLRVIVTAHNYDTVGTASTEAVKVGYASKLKVKAKKAVVNGKTVVQVVGKVKVSGVKKKQLAKALKGKITVFEGDVKVGKGKVMKGGLILVTLKGITAGKHELVVEFDGKKAADATSTEKVKV
jgi:hypothetical protein